MRRIFFILILLFSCLASFGQTFRFDTIGSNRQVMVHKDGAQFLAILGIPGDTSTVGIPVNRRRGLIAMVAGVFYYHDGSSWITPAEGSSVVSVNGFSGVVNLTTTNIPEGTNKYFTDLRVYNDSVLYLAYVKTLIAAKIGYGDTAAMLLHYMRVGDSIRIYATQYGQDTTSRNVRNWAWSTFLRSFTEADPLSFHKSDSNTHGNAATFDYVKNNFYPLSGNPAGYLVTETDPIFTASIAYWLTALDTTHYNTAYLKYPSALSFNTSTGVLTVIRNDGSGITTNLDGRYLTSFSESDPIANAKTVSISNGGGLSITGSTSQTVGSNPLWVIGLPATGTAGTYGSASQVPVTTYDTYGRETGVTNTAIVIPFTSVTGVPILQALWVTAYKRNANYNASAWEFVPFIDTSANDTLFLPSAPADSTIIGAKIVKLSGSFTTTIMCQGTDSINIYGNTNFSTISTLYESITLIYKKSTKIWTILNNDLTKSATKGLISATSPVNYNASTGVISLGNVPVANLNSGTGASGTTFWAGDGTWKVPFSLTTTGSSGAATFSAGTLNIPTPTALGLGAVTSVVVHSLSPLFTASVTVSGTTSTIDFAFINVAAHKWFGNPSALSAAPAFAFINCSDLSDAATGIASFLINGTSAYLAAALTDETGTGSAVFASAPTLTNPVVGTQAAGDNSTKAASTAYVDTYFPADTTISAAYTLTSRDIRRSIHCTNGSNIALTIPTGLGSTFKCEVIQEGAGTVTPTASGTTLDFHPSGTKTNGGAIFIRMESTTDKLLIQGSIQ